MVEKQLITQGGVYLAKLDPAKHAEVGKIRPVVVLTTQYLLDKGVPLAFVCPLSSQSYPEYQALHTTLPPRDNLKVTSYALTEHCRSLSVKRLNHPRLAQLSAQELKMITRKLAVMVS